MWVEAVERRGTVEGLRKGAGGKKEFVKGKKREKRQDIEGGRKGGEFERG